MTCARAARLAVTLLLVAGCPGKAPPEERVPDAGAFIARCEVTPISGLTCADAGPCPFVSGSELDCGVHSQAVVSTAAVSGGAAHALFAISDPKNDWHTQWVTFGPTDPAPSVHTDVLPVLRSSVPPRLALAGTGAEAPLAFFPNGDGGTGVRAALLTDAGLNPEPLGGGSGLVDVALAPGGVGYALVNATSRRELFTRGPGGTWSSVEVAPGTTYPAALALDGAGAPWVAYWVYTPDNFTPDELHLRGPSGGDTTLRLEPLRSSPGLMELAMGADDGGAPSPVVAYANEGTFVVVPDGDAGFRNLRVPEPGVTSTCPTGVLHATCNDCPNPTCSRRGESVQDLALARDSDGTVFLAVLMQRTDVDARVTATPTTVGGIVINCDCDVTTTRDGSRTTEVWLLRVVTGAAARLETRTRVPVPARASTLGFEQADGRFHLSVVDSSDDQRRPLLRHVVLDAAPLR